jgi:hypothetical protein
MSSHFHRVQLTNDGQFIDQSAPTGPVPERATPGATYRDVSNLRYGHEGSVRAVHQDNLDTGAVREMQYHAAEANKLLDPATGEPRRGSEEAHRRHVARADQALESARYEAARSEQRMAGDDGQQSTNAAIRELEIELAAQRLAEAQRAEDESLRRAGTRLPKR